MTKNDKYLHTKKGDSMKYKYLISIFVFSLILVGFLKTKIVDENNTEKLVLKQGSELVNINWEKEDFEHFYLLFDEQPLNTKNFVSIMNCLSSVEYKLLGIYPYISPLYDEQLRNIEYISMYENDAYKAIETFYNRYLMETNNLKIDLLVNSAEINGIDIRMVKIETSYYGIKTMLNKFPSIKYSMNPNGIFMKI